MGVGRWNVQVAIAERIMFVKNRYNFLFLCRRQFMKKITIYIRVIKRNVFSLLLMGGAVVIFVDYFWQGRSLLEYGLGMLVWLSIVVGGLIHSLSQRCDYSDELWFKDIDKP